MLGSWGGERLRRKGGFRVRIEALLAVWGQSSRGGGEKVLTSGPLGVKEQRVAAAARCGPPGDFPLCVLCWPDRTSARWDEGGYDGDPVCITCSDAQALCCSLQSVHHDDSRFPGVTNRASRATVVN